MDLAPDSIYKKPFWYDKDGTMVFDADNNMVLDIRGWGRIQYMDNPEQKQDAFANHVVSLLNGDYQSFIAELNKECENYCTVMIAAAEEIKRVWEAHCDEDGYGPQNLLHRLEKGIPAQYGYTAGAFEEDEKKIEDLEKKLVEAKKHLTFLIETYRIGYDDQTDIENFIKDIK